MWLDAFHVVSRAYQKALLEGNRAALSALIHDDNAVPKNTRIRIYQDNYSGTLKQVLVATFPVCQQIVGERYFNRLATYQVNHNPSCDRNIERYGATFPATIRQLIHSRPELHELPYLADMALLEWLLHQAYYAADRNAFDFDGYAQLSAQQQMDVILLLADDVALLSSAYPVCEIWQAHQHKTTQDTGYPLPDGQQYVLIQRERWRCDVQPIDKVLYQLILDIQQGKSLSSLVCSHQGNDQDGTGDRISNAITSLIRKGIIKGFSIDD